MRTRGHVWRSVAVLLLLSFTALAACGPAAAPTVGPTSTPWIVEKTVEKEKVVEKIVTATPEPKPVAVKIKAWTIGPGPMPYTRATNLEEAVNRLNALNLIPQKVVIETMFSELAFGPFEEKFFTACKAQAGPHIVTLKSIATLSEGGFLVPLDEHIQEYWGLGYDDFYSSLWDAVRYKPTKGPYAGQEHIWGIPQDATPTGVWYRKDVLRKLGYTDADIAKKLPATAEGITLADLVALAKEAKQAGLVEWGFLHRPSAGDNTLADLMIFGGRVFDPASGNLVLTRAAALGSLQWHADMVQEGLLPKAPPAWGIIHKAFVDGQTLFTFASHAGTPAEWMSQYGLSAEAFKNDMGFMAFPAAVSGANPVTILGPLAYLVTSGCVSPQDENPEAAALILLTASSADLQVAHTVQTMRPPLRKAALDHPDLLKYQYAGYIKGSTPMLQYSVDVPQHAGWSKYRADFFQVQAAVEAGILTPEAAVGELEKLLKADIPNIIFE